MNAGSRRFSRPRRSILIFVGLGGALLAADRAWLQPVSVDFDETPGWSTNISPVESAPTDFSAPADPAGSRRPELSMTQLLHGPLFSKPSSGWSWRLAPEKTELTSAWMAQQSGGTHSATQTDYWVQPSFFTTAAVAHSAILAPTAPAAVTASGTWISNASGLWSNSANWSGGVVADGQPNTADFSMLNITSNVTVTLDSSREIGHLSIGDTDGTHRYTISPSGGSTLSFFASGNSEGALPSNITQVATSAGDTISVPILMNSDLNIRNFSTTNPFTISGSIGANPGPQRFLSFNPSSSPLATGDIIVSGNIGPPGALLHVQVLGGRITFTGTNTYAGGTLVDGGTLLINGDNSGATGAVWVQGGGTLGGIGKIGGSVETFDGTITGATIGTVGTLTLLGNVNLSTGEGTGTYVADIFQNTSDLLAITGTLTLGTIDGSGSNLIVSGTLDGITTYTIATFSDLVDDFHFGATTGIPGNYTIVYNDMNIQLVPNAIPEPSTWIGGALGLAAMGWTMRRRQRLRQTR